MADERARVESATGPNPTVVFPAPGEVELADLPLRDLAAGELLVRSRRSLISTGTELTILSGDFLEGSAWSALARYPFVAGYCNVGDVVAVGPGVDPRQWVHARVASFSPHARYVIAAANSVQRAPVNDALLEAQTFTTLGQIVMNGVRRARIGWGDAVAVVGLGLLGQLAVRFARLAGARPVVAVDHSPQRLERLPADPAIVRVNPTDVDLVSSVCEATAGRMVDVVIEATGIADAIPSEFELLRETEGRFLVLSSPRGSASPFDFHDLCNAPSHTIIGAHVSSHPRVETAANPWTMARNAELLFSIMGDGEIDLSSLVSDRVPYAAAPDSYRSLVADRSRSMAVILDWDD
jgi:2-desacetyl-2-hydroxyethyl bacteriochlorophyllide A dehydrogenase